MLRIVATLLLCGGAVTVGAAADDSPESPVTLEVRPLLCIVDRRTPACDMDFLIAWQSASQGYYCLHRHFETEPLRCWNEAAAGKHEEQRVVKQSFQYWLTAQDADEPLAAVTVEVMTTETTDRRRRRRSRHVWDLL